MPAALTVSQLNFFLRSLIEGEPRLSDVLVRGEVSNYRGPHRSGHLYFSLKDDRSVIGAVMFAGAAARMGFRLEEGMKVVVRGKLTVYEPQGKYQLQVGEVIPEGVGSLTLAYERLKARLEEEGVFENRRPLPPYPQRIGVITSPTGAAVQDILRITGRRWPVAKIVLAPVLVQGEGAPAQMIAALREMNAQRACDVIVIGRGGGSLEDLWAFNDEGLVRAVHDSAIPVVSAVGHETDVTLCDFAADLRASTPSAAAELVTPDGQEELRWLRGVASELERLARQMVERRRQDLDLLAERSPLAQPDKLLAPWRERLAGLERAAASGMGRRLAQRGRDLALLSGQLDALSPLKVLSRGYAVATQEGRPIRDGGALRPGDQITLRFQRGEAAAEILTSRGEDARV